MIGDRRLAVTWARIYALLLPNPVWTVMTVELKLLLEYFAMLDMK